MALSVLAWAAVTKGHKLSALSTTDTCFSQSWRLGNARSRCWPIWCVMRALFLVAQCWLLVCPHVAEREWTLLWPLLIRTLIPLKGLHPHDQITFQRPHVQIPSHWDWAATYKSWGDQTFHPKWQYSLTLPNLSLAIHATSNKVSRFSRTLQLLARNTPSL